MRIRHKRYLVVKKVFGYTLHCPVGVLGAVSLQHFYYHGFQCGANAEAVSGGFLHQPSFHGRETSLIHAIVFGNVVPEPSG